MLEASGADGENPWLSGGFRRWQARAMVVSAEVPSTASCRFSRTIGSQRGVSVGVGR